jgi:hypothetical protein
MRAISYRSYLLLLLGVIAGCTHRPNPRVRTQTAPATQPSPAQGAIETLLLGDPDLKRIELSAVVSQPDRLWAEPVDAPRLYVARCDTEPRWWGYFCVVAVEDGRLVWTASPQGDDEPGEQSIDAARGFILPGFEHPLVEVFGTTHMGNGNYYLYQLDPAARSLRLLLKTRAFDSHVGDGEAFKNRRLHPRYEDVSDDGRVDVVLEGTIEEYEEDDFDRDHLIRSRPCRKVFVWDAREQRFSEDVARRVGFGAKGPE